MRPPVNLSRIRYHLGSQLFLYEHKPGADFDPEPLVDPLEFLARVLIHIPEPKSISSISTGFTPTGFGQPTSRGTSPGPGRTGKPMS